jgi:hypothetical protein
VAAKLLTSIVAYAFLAILIGFAGALVAGVFDLGSVGRIIAKLVLLFVLGTAVSAYRIASDRGSGRDAPRSRRPKARKHL